LHTLFLLAALAAASDWESLALLEEKKSHPEYRPRTVKANGKSKTEASRPLTK